MNATTSMIVKLEAADYEMLAAEATRRGTSPDTLVREYVHAGLTGKREIGTIASKEVGLAALNGLSALRARMPHAEPIDVVQLVQMGREDLDQRTT